MTRPHIIITPMISQAPHKPDYFWLAPIVVLVSIAAPLLLKL